MEEVSDPTSALPTEINGHILRQADGTAWYVDDKGVRHWIPDGTTWNCVGGDAIVAANARALPGYAVSALRVGTAARCNRRRRNECPPQLGSTTFALNDAGASRSPGRLRA